MSKSIVTGQDKLRRKLMALKAHLEDRVIPGELMEAGQVLAARIEANAPVDTGAMAESISVEGERARPGVRAVEVKVTGGHDDDIIGHVEFGRLYEEPNPFIRRSFYESARRIKADIASGVARGIRQFARR